MSEYRKIALSGLVALACCIAGRVPLPGVTPQVAPPVKPDAAKKPRRPLLPRQEFEAKVGGNKTPDGVEIQCDLPGNQHCKNISSRGQGCCTQTSVNHAARWQNIPALIDFHKWVQEKGLPGGGSPQTIEDRIPKCAKDRGYPVPTFSQATNIDHELLKLACKTGRMVSCTYSRSPTGRYGGSSVSHMVNCVHADDKWVGILDNNYMPSSTSGDYDNIEWMTPEEAKRAGVYEWIVVLTGPPPPPPPRNL